MRNRHELNPTSSPTEETPHDSSQESPHLSPSSRHRSLHWALILFFLSALTAWAWFGASSTPSSVAPPTHETETSRSSSPGMNQDRGGGVWDLEQDEEKEEWHPLMEWEPPEEPPSADNDSPSAPATSALLHNNWHNPDRSLQPPAHPSERVVVTPNGGVSEDGLREHNPPLSPDASSPVSGSHRLSVWFPSWNGGEALQRLEQAQDWIHEIHFLWYHLGSDGSITTIQEENDTREKALSLAREKGIRVIPTISGRFSAPLMREILHDEKKRDRLTQQISELVQAHGYDGIDILFQPMEETEREVFADWLESLATVLHRKEKVLHVTVHPQTNRSDAHSVQRAQDWHRIGKAADRVQIMAYNYSWGDPGPSTPLHWLDEVIQYAKEMMDPSKVTIALSTVGWSWPEDEPEAQRAFFYASAVELSDHPSLQPHRDQNGELHLKIEEPQERYQIWYPDGESFKTKWQWIKKHHPDIGGLALWYIGSEDPDLWTDPFDLETQ